MDLETLAINVGALQEEGFMEPEAQARDRGAVDLVVCKGVADERSRLTSSTLRMAGRR